ncbi:MAG TPA: 16S rRNA (cytidine(1402)-2'-O)-methyltransferase [Gammaproteobacteria bacterium]|jgi:16S rRNA (cytidine1402-2'-O)-methyltransferase
MSDTSGTLYVVATPIGNLGDMTARALEILQLVNFIAAEDTRHSKNLLQHFGIDKPLISLHEHNERQRVEEIVRRLRAGDNVALISDAGTPLLSDPGYVLVARAREEGLPVTPVPGPSAITAALSASGLPTDRFLFAGFTPAKSQARRETLRELAAQNCTVVLFESSHRILDLLEDLTAVLEETAGDAERRAVIARELTKRFETFLSGTPQELLSALQNDPDQQRGEFVVLLQGAPRKTGGDAEALRQCLEVLLEELPVKQAANLAAKLTGAKRNAAYQMALDMQRKRD